MNPSATKIIDGLVWLGSRVDAASESFVRGNGIECIVNVAEELDNPGVQVEQYVKFPA